MTKAYEHYISLSVGTETPEEWEQVFTTLTKAAADFANYPNVSVSSVLVGYESEEELRPLHQETMFKVSAALRESGMGDGEVTNAINSMQNYGILFRERE